MPAGAAPERMKIEKDKPNPFRRSAVGAKCACDVPETVCREHAWKRFLVPAGNYGDRYQPAGYFMVELMTLECEGCKNRREDFHVWKWHKGGDMTPIDPPFFDDKRKRRYPDIKAAILKMMKE